MAFLPSLCLGSLALVTLTSDKLFSTPLGLYVNEIVQKIPIKLYSTG